LYTDAAAPGAAMRWFFQLFRAGGTWVVLAVVFGLLPLWIRLIHAALDPSFDVDWRSVLKDGMLLYFSIAIVSAVTADYYLADQKYPKYSHIYMMVIFPPVLYIGSIIILFLTSSSMLEGDAYIRTLVTEASIVGFACVYALIHKALHITEAEEAHR
jgi:hypothetical protein